MKTLPILILSSRQTHTKRTYSVQKPTSSVWTTATACLSSCDVTVCTTVRERRTKGSVMCIHVLATTAVVAPRSVSILSTCVMATISVHRRTTSCFVRRPAHSSVCVKVFPSCVLNLSLHQTTQVCVIWMLLTAE